MKVSAATTQRFSESLLQVYAADDETSLQTALAAANAAFTADEPAGWLLGLVHGHAEHRREQEVLHRIALGETDAAIGLALGISPKTASKHVENILRKLGVETRTAAAVLVPKGEEGRGGLSA